MAQKIIRLPYKPEKIQAEIHKNLTRFNVVVVSRGGGKSYLSCAELVTRAIECPDERGALFIFIAPTRKQAKDTIWEKLKYFVRDIPCNVREDELTIRFEHNNAIIMLEGATEPDRLRGKHPHFVVLDEVGDMSRDTWYSVVLNFIDRHQAPVLAIGTPKGPTLFKELYDFAKERMDEGDPNWFCIKKNIYETGLYSLQQIEDKRKSMPEAQWMQEQMCSFDVVFDGSYYGSYLESPEFNIVTDVPWNPAYSVITGWDLGVGEDLTVIWFAQVIDNKVHIIDYFDSEGLPKTKKDIYTFASIVKNKPYRYAYHVVPHDIANPDKTNPVNTRERELRRCGFKLVTAPKMNPLEGISVVQHNLYITRIDKTKCAKGVAALKRYQAKVDKITGKVTDTPDHRDSDPADALRTLFTGMKKAHAQVSPQAHLFDVLGRDEPHREVVSEYDYFDY